MPWPTGSGACSERRSGRGCRVSGSGWRLGGRRHARSGARGGERIPPLSSAPRARALIALAAVILAAGLGVLDATDARTASGSGLVRDRDLGGDPGGRAGARQLGGRPAVARSPGRGAPASPSRSAAAGPGLRGLPAAGQRARPAIDRAAPTGVARPAAWSSRSCLSCWRSRRSGPAPPRWAASPCDRAGTGGRPDGARDGDGRRRCGVDHAAGPTRTGPPRGDG